MPKPQTPVSLDKDLGTEKKPAKTCMDIKQWGKYKFYKINF